jgi:hypothetical protein
MGEMISYTTEFIWTFFKEGITWEAEEAEVSMEG